MTRRVEYVLEVSEAEAMRDRTAFETLADADEGREGLLPVFPNLKRYRRVVTVEEVKEGETA